MHRALVSVECIGWERFGSNVPNLCLNSTAAGIPAQQLVQTFEQNLSHPIYSPALYTLRDEYVYSSLCFLVGNVRKRVPPPAPLEFYPLNGDSVKSEAAKKRGKLPRRDQDL